MRRVFPTNPRGQELPTGLCVLLLSVLFSSAAAAQEGALVTDRPDFTESAESVERGHLQLEAGYSFEDGGREEVHTVGETLLRIGLSGLTELRLELPSYVDPGGPRGFADASIGLKLEAAAAGDEHSFLEPAMALIVSTTLPTGEAEIGEPHLQPGVLLALAWPLGERFAVGSNVGLTYASSDGEQFAEARFSTALGADLGGAWGGFLEYYGFFPENAGGEARHFVDGGLTYLLSSDLQLDARIGTEPGGETDLFAGVGLAYRW